MIGAMTRSLHQLVKSAVTSEVPGNGSEMFSCFLGEQINILSRPIARGAISRDRWEI